MKSPSQLLIDDITGESHNEILCSFDSMGVYLLTRPSESGNNWSAERLTPGTPDADHKLWTGRIFEDQPASLFLTHQGRTYYYSYHNGLASFVNAPLKAGISVRFTGNSDYYLLVCESTSGNFYLYRPTISKWDILLFSGH